MTVAIDTTDVIRWPAVCSDHENFFEHSAADSVGIGTHTGSNNATTLQDTTKSWKTNEWAGRRVVNTTDGSHCEVTANTAKTITCKLDKGTDNDWDSGDGYAVHRMVKPILTNRFLMDVKNTDYCDLMTGWINGLSSYFDAAFLDIGRPTWYPIGWPDYPYDWVDEATYQAEKTACMDRIGRGTNRITVYNGLNDTMENAGVNYLNNLDGAMDEGFIFARGKSKFFKNIAISEIEDIITMRNANKIYIAMMKPLVSDTKTRLTGLSCYMLVLYKNSYIAMQDGMYTSMRPTFFPEYKIDIGEPQEEFDSITDSIEQTYFWVRDFSKGKVIVNPEKTDHFYTFSGSYEKAVVSGGGMIGDYGSPSGTLTWTTVNSPLSIEQGTGIILRKKF